MGLFDTEYTVYFQAAICSNVLVFSITAGLSQFGGDPISSQLLVYSDGRYKFKIQDKFRPNEKKSILSQAESYCDDFGFHKPTFQIWKLQNHPPLWTEPEKLDTFWLSLY